MISFLHLMDVALDKEANELRFFGLHLASGVVLVVVPKSSLNLSGCGPVP